MTRDRLVLGIDGGGTKTVAWLARCDPAGDLPVIGRAVAGPANPQAVGFARATENLDLAVAATFDDAGAQVGPVVAAVIALAGSDRDASRRVLEDWAKQRRLARHFRVVHDALPVLVAGSPDGWGVALIAGTGSFAFGRARDGRTARAGGWGFRFGDEGSGYAVAVAGLRAAAKSADGRGPATRLLDGLLARLALQNPPELIAAISRMATDQAAIAALAEVVTQTADEGDGVAQQIVDEAAGDLACMVAAVARKLDLPTPRFPLALAGSMLLGSHNLRERLKTRIGLLGLLPDPVAEVSEPVVGALRLARADAMDR